MIKGIKNKDIDDFKNTCNKLNNIMKRISNYNEDAQLYLANETLNLMCGESHDMNGRPLQENVVADVIILGLSGGDW
jgi:hypothetical protein